MALTPERKKYLYENVVRNMPLEEIEYMKQILKTEQDIAGRHLALQFNVGDRVAFGRPNGMVRIGHVTGFGKKNINVDCGAYGKWRVPPSMLKKCEDVPVNI